MCKKPLWLLAPFLIALGIGHPPIVDAVEGDSVRNSAILEIDLASGMRLLGELESCRVERAEIDTLRRLDEKNSQLDEVRVEREKLLRERIQFLESQQAELFKMNDQAIKAADLARKSGGGSWWEQLFTAGKWIGLGIALGFVVGAGK